jgi:hypothetical protein|nr:MAG TPA_asm: hypothetical protein [Caudoviricetes sp.]
MASKTIKAMGVSPITNTIYYGNVNEEKGLWVGEKKGVTDMAIGAVFEWFLNQMDGKEEFGISYPSVPGIKLKMVREE